MSFHLAVFCPIAKRRTVILGLCRAFFHLHNHPCKVIAFTSYDAILAEPFFYDAYLLPIAAPTAGNALPDGILLAQKLRAQGMQNPIIFASHLTEWAFEAFRVDALQFLPIPLSRDLLYPALARALAPHPTSVFSVTTPDGIYNLPFHEIESVECTNHILHFHCLSRTTIHSVTLRISLRTAVADLLSDRRFVQPHRSYVVNLAAVKCLYAAELEMKSGMRIPIPRERYSTIKAAYLAFAQNSIPPVIPK